MRVGGVVSGQRVGYVRVSTLDQSTVRQLDGIALDRVFEDKASGKDVDRPQLEALIGFVRDGDTVLVHSMDQLARNLGDLRRLVRRLTDKQVRVEFVKEQLTFTGEDSAMANLLLNMMGAIAEFERELIRERQREGIVLAKQRGVYRGRARSLTVAQVDDLRARVAAGVPKSVLAAAAVLEDGGEGTADQDPDWWASVVVDEVDAVGVSVVGVPSGTGPHEVAHVPSEHGSAVDPPRCSSRGKT